MNLARYIGIPYSDRGRDPAVSLDCWGLVRWWYANELGIQLPAWDEAPSYRYRPELLPDFLQEQARLWTPVKVPEVGDVLLLRVGRHPHHIGVYVGQVNGERKFLHTTEGIDSVLCPVDCPVWAPRIHGAYRYG